MAVAQDPTGVLEGQVTDKSGGAIVAAVVSIRNLRTGFAQTQSTSDNGFYRVSLLPPGAYELKVEAPKFSRFSQQPIQVVASQTSRVDVLLELGTVAESVTVAADASPIDTSTNILGKTVSGREVLDLSLNGRNFTQLGLLQVGVAPLPAGLLRIGGTLREGQAYSVNGQRPESNNYLLDGSENNNRVDGGTGKHQPRSAGTRGDLHIAPEPLRVLYQSACGHGFGDPRERGVCGPSAGGSRNIAAPRPESRPCRMKCTDGRASL